MNPKDPMTWLDIAKHPFYRGGPFQATWYDGDLQIDLTLLRNAAQRILNDFSSTSVELNVLDDSTIFVRVSQADSTIIEIYPTRTNEGASCYFIDFGPETAEIRVRSVEGLIEVLRHSR